MLSLCENISCYEKLSFYEKLSCHEKLSCEMDGFLGSDRSTESTFLWKLPCCEKLSFCDKLSWCEKLSSEKYSCYEKLSCNEKLSCCEFLSWCKKLSCCKKAVLLWKAVFLCKAVFSCHFPCLTVIYKSDKCSWLPDNVLITRYQWSVNITLWRMKVWSATTGNWNTFKLRYFHPVLYWADYIYHIYTNMIYSIDTGNAYGE